MSLWRAHSKSPLPKRKQVEQNATGNAGCCASWTFPDHLETRFESAFPRSRSVSQCGASTLAASNRKRSPGAGTMKPCLKVAIASSKTPARCESRACENHRRHGTNAGGLPIQVDPQMRHRMDTVTVKSRLYRYNFILPILFPSSIIDGCSPDRSPNCASLVDIPCSTTSTPWTAARIASGPMLLSRSII